MPYQGIGKILIVFGVLLIVSGALFYATPKVPLLARLLEPWRWQKGALTLYFPIGICAILSLLLTLLLRFWRS